MARSCRIATVALTLLVVATPGALADDGHPTCPHGDGTIPGSDSRTVTVGPDDGTQYQTIFIDDRDALDLDDDGVAGSLWIYVEENELPGLTRGGDQIAFRVANPQIPYVAPWQVVPPNPGGLPILPSGVALFPQGFGGTSLSEAAGEHDACVEYGGEDGPAAPDALLL